MSDSKRETQSSTENKDIDKTIQKFLEHVVKGEEKEVEEMLKADPSLAFKKGKVTDYSGRQFIGIGDDKEGISGFQYAIWARDTDMWLDLLPKIKDSKNVGIDSIDIDAIPELAKQQLKEVNEIGLTYIPPEPVSDEEKDRIKKEDEEERKLIKKMIATEKKDDPFFDRQNPMSIMLSYHSKFNLKTEKEYDFQITKALESFVAYMDKIRDKNGDGWNDWDALELKDWKKVGDIWARTVGCAQRLVPVHVANQYCRADLPFKLKPPTFNTSDAKESLKGHRTVKFCSDGVSWFPLESQKSDNRMGIHYGVISVPIGARPERSVGLAMHAGWRCAVDLAAMIALREARQLELKTLMEKLLSPKKGMKV